MICCNFEGFVDDCEGIGKIVGLWAARLCDIDTFNLTSTGTDCDTVTELPLSGYAQLYELSFNQDTAIFAAPIVTDENKSSVMNATLTFSVRRNCANYKALGIPAKTAIVIERSNGKFELFGWVRGGLFLNSSEGLQNQAATAFIQVQLALNNAPVGGNWLRPFEVNGSYEDTLAYIEALAGVSELG